MDFFLGVQLHFTINLNKDNQDLEGIYSLKLVTAESEKDESNPGLDSDERKVIGIYNPEWD